MAADATGRGAIVNSAQHDRRGDRLVAAAVGDPRNAAGAAMNFNRLIVRDVLTRRASPPSAPARMEVLKENRRSDWEYTAQAVEGDHAELAASYDGYTSIPRASAPPPSRAATAACASSRAMGWATTRSMSPH